MGRADDEGRYEIELDGPGDHVIVVGRDGMASADAEFFVRVPDERTFTYDVALPMGGVEGRVTDGRGGQFHVTVRLEPLAETFVGVEGGRPEVCGGGGAFRFERVPPGRYRLRATEEANGVTFRSLIGPELVVGEDVVRDVELAFGPGGRIEGTVTDAAGQPVVGASLFCRDATGELLTTVSDAVTGARGSYLLAVVPAGRWTVVARHGDAVVSGGPVVVPADGAAELDLTLRPGTAIVVEVSGPTGGAPTIEVRDGVGADWSRVRTQADLDEIVRTGFSTRRVRTGPLPRGTYTVTVTLPDGRRKQREVELGAPGESATERTVDVRF
jgi:hypothetical protein